MLALVAVALGAERVETATLDGEPVVLRVDDAAARFGVRKQAEGDVQRDWTGATVLSAGMRRWWTLMAVRDKAIRDLTGRDAPAWVERALERCPDDSPAHLWLATAASLGGTNLDRVADAELASQEAARFRQKPQAQPLGLYALDELRPLAALDAWLARPLPTEVRSALEPILTGPMRSELAKFQEISRGLFGKGDPSALVPRGSGDPLVALINRDLSSPEPEPAPSPTSGPMVRPQQAVEPCERCSHLGPAVEAGWMSEPAFQGMPLLLVPTHYDERNRPVLRGFVGVRARRAEIFYAAPPGVRDAAGAPVHVVLAPQTVTLLEPRAVEVVLEGAPTQAELATRFTSTLQIDDALADLRPPAPARGCGCTTPMGSPGWWARVRRRTSTE